MTAVVAEPGTPRASRGANPLIEAALLAASGAATPAMLPFPKVSGCFDAFFSARYARNDAVVMPPAGMRPIRKPMMPQRTIAQRLSTHSCHVRKTELSVNLSSTSTPLSGSSMLLKTSAKPKIPQMTTTKSIPPRS